MWLHLFNKAHMHKYIWWLYARIILHNMLSSLCDAWTNWMSHFSRLCYGLFEANSAAEPDGDPATLINAEAFHTKINSTCIKMNYDHGTLPIRI
ncbi:hypothetical protein VP01_3157g2 [Puccinia sorghi]|uniref:Uncharacterized protein n=1 Tax=Puccinia sorghi TaxID=27349 RepID=A0A0L6UZN7_9BASI|nr:hypothetical protein VP01_3157g2 [Puccinia sorghi]